MRIFKPLNQMTIQEQIDHHLELAENYLELAEKDEKIKTALMNCAKYRIELARELKGKSNE